MKKNRMPAALLCTVCLCLTPVFANAGPVSQPSGPAGAAAPVDGSGVHVLHENLALDYSGKPLGAGVCSAVYRMRSERPQHVDAAFPVLAQGVWTGEAQRKLAVEWDGQPLEVRAWLGPEETEETPLLERPFRELLELCRPQDQPECMGQAGVLYTLTVTGEGGARLAAGERSIAQWPELVSSGPDGVAYGWDDPDGNPRTKELFVLGNREPEWTGGAQVSERSSMVLGDYLAREWEAHSRNGGELMEALDDGQAAAEAARTLEKQWGGGEFAADSGMLFEPLHRTRLYLLTFSMEFRDGEEHTLAVTSPISAGFGTESSGDRTFHIQYFFEPASHWASFGELEGAVTLPEGASAPEALGFALLPEGEGVYTFRTQGLPRENLTAVFQMEGDGSGLADTGRALLIAGVVVLAVPALALIFAGVWVVRLCRRFKDDL